MEELHSWKYGLTALSWASTYGHLSVVAFLLTQGASLDVEEHNGLTALHLASFNSHLPVVEFLVTHGASLGAQDKNSYTALHYASFNGHLPIVAFLITHGSSLNVQTVDGQTALHCASFKGHLPVVEFLITHCASLDVQSGDDQTALLYASSNGHLPVVEFLINHGASITAQNKDGRTPVDVARTDRVLQQIKRTWKQYWNQRLHDRLVLSTDDIPHIGPPRVDPSTCPIQRLPEDILRVIFSLLGSHDLLHARLVCREWWHLISDASIGRAVLSSCPCLPHSLAVPVRWVDALWIVEEKLSLIPEAEAGEPVHSCGEDSVHVFP